MYSFLASLLRTEPSDALIQEVADLKGDGTPIGNACVTLAHLAKRLDNESIRNEYVNLFIGVGRGEILPFASYYLTGIPFIFIRLLVFPSLPFNEAKRPLSQLISSPQTRDQCFQAPAERP